MKTNQSIKLRLNHNLKVMALVVLVTIIIYISGEVWYREH